MLVDIYDEINDKICKIIIVFSILFGVSEWQLL